MKSFIEQVFEGELKQNGLAIGMVREHLFCERKWRFDFAWPNYRLAVEIEGGVWTGGRHTRGKGFSEDCVKYNTATSLGWKVLRFTGDHIESGYALAATKDLLKIQLNKG